MPQVGNKKYPYTKEGIQQAKQDTAKYGITDQMADEWLKKNPVNTKHGGYIKRDTVREMMKDSQSMKPITVTPNDGQLPKGLQHDMSKENVFAHQRDLKKLGFYEGELDSIWGPKSQAAYEMYLKNPPKTKQELSVEKLKSGGAFGKQGKRIFDYIKSLRD
jgi:hypothetical protein